MADTPEWVLQLFDELNTEHFKGNLSRPIINVQDDAMRSSNAWYIHTPQIKTPKGPLICIGLTQEVLAKGRAYTADTMLHEMVHHALATLHGLRWERDLQRTSTNTDPPDSDSQDRRCRPAGRHRGDPHSPRLPVAGVPILVPEGGATTHPRPSQSAPWCAWRG